jgi:hypothetical protein
VKTKKEKLEANLKLDWLRRSQSLRRMKNGWITIHDANLVDEQLVLELGECFRLREC